MTQLQQILATNIRTYRQKNGFSQNQLAEKAGLSTNYVSQIECGQRFPSPQMIEKLALAMEVEDFELFAPEKIDEHNMLALRKLLSNKMNDLMQDVFGG